MQYYYKIYGLYICSELIIEEALECKKNDNYDVMIFYERFVDDVDISLKKRVVEKNRIQFFVDKVGEYIVENGNIIRIIAFPSTSILRIKCFLLGSAFGYLMIQRQKVALHGCCVAKNKEMGIVVTGESGSGKSTIGTNLFMEGYKFVADDVCALREEENGIIVEMAYPQQKLCEDAAIQLGYSLDKLILLNEKRKKYGARLKSSKSYELEVKLVGIFEIRVDSNVEEIQFEEVFGHRKLMLFLENIFRYKIMQELGLEKNFLQHCLSIIQKIPMYCIIRPVDQNTHKEIIDIIKQTCKEKVLM